MPRDRVADLEARIDSLKDEMELLRKTVANQNEIVIEHRRQWLIFIQSLRPAPPRIDPADLLAAASS